MLGLGNASIMEGGGVGKLVICFTCRHFFIIIMMNGKVIHGKHLDHLIFLGIFIPYL